MEHKTQTLRISSEKDVAYAINLVEKLDQELDFSKVDACMVLTSVSELAMNIVKYAQQGVMSAKLIEQEKKRGIEINFIDEGPGIADLDLAFQDNYSTGGSLGLGLPGVRRLVDEMSINSQLGQGTEVKIVKWETHR